MHSSHSPRSRALRRALAALWVPCLAQAAAAEAGRTVLLAQVTEETASEQERGPAAPPGSAPPPGVEVIRVRGRGLSRVVPAVPASVTTFDAATIEALGAQDVSDLSRVTPNVNIVQPGATQATFFVRGIGLADPSANSAGAVTIFQDGVALNAPAIQTGQLYDIESVEVLRGPQGSGAFRNASAGAIRVSSNLPTGNYGARIRATVGRYAARGGQGAKRARIQDYEGYVQMPIVEGALSSRFAFRLRKTDPFQTNGCGNARPFELRDSRPTNPALLDELDECGERSQDIWPLNQKSRIRTGLPREVDYEDNWAARGFLRLQPPESDLDLLLNVHGSRLDQDQVYGQAIGTERVAGRGAPFGGTTAGGYQEPDQAAELEARCMGLGTCPAETIARFEKRLAEDRPLDRKPFRGDYNHDGVTKRDVWGGFLRGELELGEIDLSVLASYDRYDRLRDHDTDFTPEILFEVDEADESWQTYEAIRLAGELATRPLQWELGAYFLAESLESTSRTDLRSFAPDQRNAIDRDFAQDTRSFGAWGGFAWDFLDDLTLEVGGRLNWERKDFELVRQQFLFGSARPQQSAEQSETWVAPTGHVVLTYHLNQDVSAFLKYGRGFKSGHFNALASEDLDRPPADRELNDAWEAGLSGRWIDRRLSATATYFYYRYTDYQVFLFRDVAGTPPVLEIVNAPEAENYGIELEARLEPLIGWTPRAVEGLVLTANFGWLHGEFLDFQLRNTIATAQGTVPVTVDFSGRQFQNSPDFKFSGSAAWTFDLGRWGFLIPRYHVSWSDDVFYGVNEGRGSVDISGEPKLPAFGAGQPAFWLHDFRLSYRTPTTNVEVAAWVRNATDEVYKSFAFDASRFSAVVLNFVGHPRTIGIDVTLQFP